MKSRTRALLLVFCLVLIAVAATLGAFWFYASNLDRSGWIQRGDNYYYLDQKGQPISGWLEEEGTRYYFDQEGAMVTGWQSIDGSRYCFSDSGIMRTGWLEQDGSVYYFQADGTPASGWMEADGQRRFFLEDGLMATGWQTVSGLRYFFSPEGTVTTGWLNQPEGVYYLGATGQPATGLTDIDGRRYYFFETSGLMAQGLIDLEDGRYCFGDDGVMLTGWQNVDGRDRYFSEDGRMVTGWIQEGEYRYYLLEDGTKAVSPTVIDGETCFFTPDGIYVLLVNYQYPIPESYQPEIVQYNKAGLRVAAIAEQALRQMILDCRATGIECWLNCGHRTRAEQTEILRERTKEHQEKKGMDYNTALEEALKTVAVPGYSEHETGLAMDIVCSVDPVWLHEHCWEYGFILRYPENKSAITHISYEHWHYRYVGVEVAMKMKDTGLCLEEYLGAA